MPMIELGVAAGASGWVGFGLSDVGGMKGADIVVYEAATGQLTDYYSMDYVAPTVDTCPNDWVLLNHSTTSSTSTGSSSFVWFQATRRLNTHDAQDWSFQDDSRWDVQPTHVIVAWGDQETMSYHGPANRAGTTVRFFADDDDYDHYLDSTTTTEPSNLQHLQEISDGSFLVTAQNYAIPTSQTTYYDFCRDWNEMEDFPLSSTGRQQQQPIYVVGIAFANSLEVNGVDTYSYIHHFSAFGNSRSCDGTSYEAQNIFYGWGPGQQPFIMPQDVGIAIGGDSAIQSLALQIHYNNPAGVAGLVDSTGIRVFYVTTPPQHEAAAMVVGDGNMGLLGQPAVGADADGPVVAHRFTCPSSCTSSHFAAPVTIFAEALHQHETGRRSVHQVIRKLKQDNSPDRHQVVHQSSVEVWDYPHGGIKIVQQQPYELHPGDVFRTYCYYDSTAAHTSATTASRNENNNPRGSATTTHYFGLGTQDEMCQAMFWYYPAIATSHGFCGVSLSNSFGAGNTDCDAVHVQTNLDATTNFDRWFGSEPKNGVCGTSAAIMDESEATIVLDELRPGDSGLVATYPTEAPTHFSGNPVCHVCGEGYVMTQPDANLTVPGGSRPCSQIRDAGLEGFIKENLCGTTRIFVSIPCGCSNRTEDIEMMMMMEQGEKANGAAGSSGGSSWRAALTIQAAWTFGSWWAVSIYYMYLPTML